MRKLILTLSHCIKMKENIHDVDDLQYTINNMTIKTFVVILIKN